MELSFTVVQVQKGATIFECNSCGAVVLHKTLHTVWHELWDLVLLPPETDDWEPDPEQVRQALALIDEVFGGRHTATWPELGKDN